MAGVMADGDDRNGGNGGGDGGKQSTLVAHLTNRSHVVLVQALQNARVVLFGAQYLLPGGKRWNKMVKRLKIISEC